MTTVCVCFFWSKYGHYFIISSHIYLVFFKLANLADGYARASIKIVL